MDINEEAEKSLSKTGYDIVFHYPQSFLKLPVISFYTLKEQGGAAYDNREYFREGTIAVDIWAKVPSETGRIYESVRKILLQDGWAEIFAADIPGEDTGIYHRSVRFTKSFYIE